MLSKNNRKLQERKLEQKQRFGFRKYSFGLASALIGVSFMLTTGGTVSADTTTPAENAAAATTTNNADLGTTSTDTTKSEATDTKSNNAVANTTATSATDTKTDSTATEANNTASDSSDKSTETKSDSAATNIAEETETKTSTDKTSEAASEDKSSATTDSNTSADQSSASASTDSTAKANTVLARAASTTAATTDASTTTDKAASTTATDDAASAEGKITDEGKAKGLTDSDVTPGMGDPDGASLVIDNSKIPNGYKADPTEGRYTFAIISLGGDFDPGTSGSHTNKTYNTVNGTKYYLRFSTDATSTSGKYDSTVYAQLVDAATSNSIVWQNTLAPNSGDVHIDKMEENVTDKYWLTYTVNATSSQIRFSTDNGLQYSKVVYSAANSADETKGTYISVTYPDASTVTTEYIAKDAKGNETELATYEETGRRGYTYTASGERTFKGYDLISSPSSTSGTLYKSYKVGDIYVNTVAQLSDKYQIARVYVTTATNGTAKIELKIAPIGASQDDIADESVWKTFLSTDPVAPGEFSDQGNYDPDKVGKNNAFLLYNERNQPIGVSYLTAVGIDPDDLTREKLSKYKTYQTIYGLNNRLSKGQESIKYYYAPQGQVRINYVTSDGTVIQSPVSAYENSGKGTAYDVTGSTYKPETITVNGKTYRYVKSDKSLGKADTAEINGYTYNVTPSDATGTISSTTVNDVYYVYEPVTYKLNKDEESKTVTRTINYVDSVTGKAIPSELEPSVTQTATLTRSVIYDDQGNKIGYGTVSEDGTSYTLDDSWKVADQTWTEQKSADLSDYGYTAPDKETVAAENVDGSTTDTVVTVYYGHQTTPVKPTDPKTPGEPINPKGNVNYPDGVSKDDLTSTVKRTINYVDEDGNKVNGSPDGTSSYEQTAEFTRTAIVDKVTGKILGYDTNNDGKVDTESADRAWQPTSKTLEAVKSADPSSVGYDNVDISNVSSLVVTPGQGDTTVTVTYSNNQVSGTIKYIDDTTGVELDSDNLKAGKIGSIIDYKTEDKIKSYEDQGYELVSNDFTDGSQVYKKTGNDFVVHLKHKTQTITPNDPNPVTPGEPINPNDPNSPVYGEETDRKNLVKNASQTIHYVGAGDKTPADNVVTQKDAFTRTVTIDKVTGKVLSYTDWKGEKTFNTVDTPVVNGYHADKKVAGGLTATVDNPDVEETVTYSPNGKIVPVDPNNTPIPGADTPTYPTDPDDPTKVVPNEPIPEVPGWNPVDPSPVTPEDPTKDTPVVYTQAKYGLTEKFVDESGNDLVPSVSKGTDYKSGDKYDVTKDAKVITGYVLVKTTDTTGTFTDGNKTAVFTYKKLGKIIPVDPNGNPIPGVDTPTYKNDPDDPSKVVPNEPTPTVPGYKTDVPKVTPEDPTKDTPVPYTKNETPAAKYGLTEKFVDENGNDLVPSVSKGTDYKSGDKYDVTKDAKVITGYVLVKTTDTTGTFTDGNKTAVFTYKKLGKIVPVDPNGNPIPGADTPTYKNDPDDPSKVVPNEPTPTVPGYKTNVPNVAPEDPTKDTPVPYTKDETPATKYGLTEKFVDENGNDLVPSVSKGTDYKSGDKYDVTKDAKVITGYVLVKTTDTTGTFTDGNKTAVFTYKKLGKIVPVDPNGNPIPGADTPTYKNDPDDPSKVVPNEPTPDVPGYKTDVPKVTPEDPTKDTPVVYTKKTTPETPAAKYGLTEKFVDENGNDLVPSVSKGTDYKSGDKYDVTKDAKVITGYVLVKTTDTTGTFGDSDKTAVFTYKKIGKIVPVDKDGNPIPGAETPSYKNDPSDPSKVLPNEPTPDVLGYKTDVPSVTPEDPTKDTPVPYTKSMTPSKPSNNKPGKKGAPSAPTGPTSPTLPGGKKGKIAPATPNATAFSFSTGSSKQTASLKQNAQAKLPQTGEATDKSRALSVLGLGVIALTALLGLAIDKKRNN